MTAPAWHDKPTEPGKYIVRRSGPRLAVPAECVENLDEHDIKYFSPEWYFERRFFGPIPPDPQQEQA